MGAPGARQRERPLRSARVREAAAALLARSRTGLCRYRSARRCATRLDPRRPCLLGDRRDVRPTAGRARDCNRRRRNVCGPPPRVRSRRDWRDGAARHRPARGGAVPAGATGRATTNLDRIAARPYHGRCAADKGNWAHRARPAPRLAARLRLGAQRASSPFVGMDRLRAPFPRGHGDGLSGSHAQRSLGRLSEGP